MSKITDQNVRNVFNALEKHKQQMEEKLQQQEIEVERLRGTLNQIETDHTIGNVLGRKGSTLRGGRNSQMGGPSMLQTPKGEAALTQVQLNEIQIKMEYVERQ